MSQTTYNKYILSCEADDIDVYFEYNNSVIYSKKKTKLLHMIGWN